MIDRDPQLAHISEILWMRLRELRHLMQHNLFMTLAAYVDLLERHPDVFDPSLIPNLLITSIRDTTERAMDELNIPALDDEKRMVLLIRYLMEDTWYSADEEERITTKDYVATVINQEFMKQEINARQRSYQEAVS